MSNAQITELRSGLICSFKKFFDPTLDIRTRLWSVRRCL